MTVPRNEPVVLIIDALPLRSLGLVSILSRLDHLDFAGKTRIISHLPDAAERWIEAHTNCEMLIYNVGGASIADHDNSQRIKALRAIAPDVPLVIFSESESREEIISALNVGAQGLLYAGMNSELALQAFSFILKGGSYFPSALRPRRSRRERPRHRATEQRDELPASHSRPQGSKPRWQAQACAVSLRSRSSRHAKGVFTIID